MTEHPAGRPSRVRAGDFLTELFRSPLDPGYAAAARRRAAGPPPGGAQQRTGLGLRTVALVIIGFLLAVAYHQVTAAQPAASRARAGLVADVKAHRSAADDLQKRADKLREQVSRERDAALSDSAESARLRNLEVASGVRAVHGDGIVIRLADGPAPVDPVTGKPAVTNPGRVLDRDLQDIANQLWRLGAEAIAVNGERLAATTTIRAAGDAILVDFAPITAPYEVSAIGPGGLLDTFNASLTAKRFHTYASTYRMQFSAARRGGLTLPAAGEPSLRYAKPPAPSPASPSGAPVPSASGGSK